MRDDWGDIVFSVDNYFTLWASNSRQEIIWDMIRDEDYVFLFLYIFCHNIRLGMKKGFLDLIVFQLNQDQIHANG